MCFEYVDYMPTCIVQGDRTSTLKDFLLVDEFYMNMLQSIKFKKACRQTYVIHMLFQYSLEYPLDT